MDIGRLKRCSVSIARVLIYLACGEARPSCRWRLAGAHSSSPQDNSLAQNAPVVNVGFASNFVVAVAEGYTVGYEKRSIFVDPYLDDRVLHLDNGPAALATESLRVRAM